MLNQYLSFPQNPYLEKTNRNGIFTYFRYLHFYINLKYFILHAQIRILDKFKEFMEKEISFCMSLN